MRIGRKEKTVASTRVEWQKMDRGRNREGGGEGRQRDDKHRLRAFAAVLEPRLISPITPYSAATHVSYPASPALPMLSLPLSLHSSCPRIPLVPPSLPLTTRRPSCSEQRWNVWPALVPVTSHSPPARAPLPSTRSLLSLHRLYTTSVDEVCLTRGSVYRTYYRFPLLVSSPPPPFTFSSAPRLPLFILLVPRTSEHGPWPLM